MVDTIELTRELVRLETPTGDEGPAVEFLADLLGRLGYRVIRQPVTPGRDNLYAWREPPVVVFSTHLDCVPPYVPLARTRPPVRPRDLRRQGPRGGDGGGRGRAGGGRGAANRPAVRRRRGERLRWARSWPHALEPKGRFLINGEPTENRLSMGQKGSLKVVLECEGRRRALRLPRRGRSAMLPLLDALERLRRLPLPTDPMLGVGNAEHRGGGGRRGAERDPAGSARGAPAAAGRGHRTSSSKEIAACAADGVRVKLSRPSCRTSRTPRRRRRGGRPQW